MIRTTALTLGATALALSLMGVQACEPEPEPDLQWYYTCGDPVCSGWTPKDDVPLCDGQAAGAMCSEEGATCDPKDDCNALLTCAEEDPRQQPGGCPISSREVKKEVQYLTAPELSALHTELKALPLARYRYTAPGADGEERLGFIIEDAPTMSAIDQPKDMIDLYSYASMAVAAIQVQSAQIDALETRLQNLEACQEAPASPESGK